MKPSPPNLLLADKFKGSGLQIIFVTATSKFPSWLEEINIDYTRKISFWFKTEIKNLNTKSVGRDSKEHKIKIESEKFLKFIEKTDYVVLCDEKGKVLKSIQFAQSLERIFQTGKKRLVFIIGGAYGVTPELKERADLVLSLSSLTFNHHVAFAVLLEQVYRGLTIIKGIKYHNE